MHNRFFILSLLLSASYFANAQSNNLHFQLKAGGQLSNHLFKDLIVKIDTVYDQNGNFFGYSGQAMLKKHQFRLGIDIGGYMIYTPPQWKYFNFTAGLSYRQRGFIKKVIDPNFNIVSTNNRLDYLSLDLGLKVRMTKIIYWVAGLRYDYLIYKNTHPSFDFYMNYFKGTEYSPFFIQGFNMNIFKKYTTAIEIEMNPGIQKLNLNNDKFPYIPSNYKNYLTNFAMSLNLVVGIRK